MNLTDWPVLKAVQPYILKSTRLAYVFGENGEEALLVTHQDRVYGIGKNKNGHLGLGDELPRSHATEVKALSGRNIKGLTSGGNPHSSEGLFVISYLQDGTVYEWGSVPGCENPLLKPHEVHGLKHKVVDVACGISHSLALCETGEVYSWGIENRGNLGRPVDQNNSNITDPIAKHLTAARVRGILQTAEVVKIACGANFSVVLTNDKIVTWGCNKFGQLGLRSTASCVSEPSGVKIIELPKFLKFVCGPDYVFGLKVDNTLMFWGNNRELRMLSANAVNEYDAPSRITDRRFVHCSNIMTSYLFSLTVAETSSGIVIYGLNSGSRKFESAKDVFFEQKKHMCEPWFQSKQQRRTISDVLAYAFDYVEKSDLTIRVDEKEIYVHKYLLMLRSDFFTALIQNRNNTAESDSNIMTITGYTYEVIYAYLKFLYTDDLDVDFHLAVELFELSNEYVDDDLKIKTIEVIMEQLTVEKVVDVYPLACKFSDSEKLMDRCVDIAMTKLSAVVNSPNYNWDGDVSTQFLRQLATKRVMNPTAVSS